jgi:hypothetical protein
MNERIRECWLKAAREDSDDKWDTQEQFIERFAELIIQECVEQIQICSEQIKNDDGYADDNIWPIMQSIVDAVAIDVKEHFGVES